MISNANENGFNVKCNGRPRLIDRLERMEIGLNEHFGLPPNRYSTVSVHDCDMKTNILGLLASYNLVEIVESAFGRLFVEWFQRYG